MALGGLFDVVIVEMATRKVVAVVGENLPMDGGRFNATFRQETAMHRINLDTHTVEIVPAGKVKKDDTLQTENHGQQVQS